MQYRLEMFATEEDLENASLYEPSSFVGVVFMDPSAMSYRLRFPYDQLPQPNDYTESFGKYWFHSSFKKNTSLCRFSLAPNTACYFLLF